MNNGWIKLHRKIKDNPLYKNSKAVHCWIECLLRANHSKKDYYLGRKKIPLKPGQFILGRDEFGKSIGISGTTAWFWLLQFELDSMLDIKKTVKGSLCTVKEWKKYQALDSTLDNKKTAEKQQKNTDKNVKKEKNEKKHLAKQSFADKINPLIDCFSEVNPSYERLFANKTQRATIDRLLKKFTPAQLTAIIKSLPTSNAEQYAPTITTPVQLENKLGQLKAFWDTRKNNKSKNVTL